MEDSGHNDRYDVVIVGAGVSASFIAWNLAEKGIKCLLLEAGSYFHAETYPTNELDSNSKLYWGGGLELNTEATIGFLRPKVVGGGSVVNQALLDRFDDIAFNDWQKESGIDYFSKEKLSVYYDIVDEQVESQEIPEEFRNRNARIFEDGFNNNGYKCAPLVRAQKDCKYENGNDCIECLCGCRIDSKQSTPITVLKRAVEKGARVVPDFEVHSIISGEVCIVSGKFTNKQTGEFRAKKIILAAGSVGNPRILLNSGYKNPIIGKGFYTHPQQMIFGLYDEVINAHKGPFQSLKSDDETFRLEGFKLENVFGPPVGLSMLFPDFGKKHRRLMEKIDHLACIEVAVRDTATGSLSYSKKGKPIIRKPFNKEDIRRWNKGKQAIYNIFKSTGAREIIPGFVPIGLHQMGGCAIGSNPAKSVVDPEFKLHEDKNVFIADGSIFPNAPGINPSMTIMALSIKSCESILKSL